MKTLTKSVLIILCITFLSSSQLFGQEWSADQKEVWKNVETYWELAAKDDVEGWLSHFHDDFSGWNNRDALPTNKGSRTKFGSHSIKTTEILVQELQPVGINIHSNMAIVQYYYSRVFKDVEGKEENAKGRWTDIFIKQGDKWVLIGDHGGSSSTN